METLPVGFTRERVDLRDKIAGQRWKRLQSGLPVLRRVRLDWVHMSDDGWRLWWAA